MLFLSTPGNYHCCLFQDLHLIYSLLDDSMRFSSFLVEFEVTKEELFIILGFVYFYLLLWNWKWSTTVERKCDGLLICQE